MDTQISDSKLRMIAGKFMDTKELDTIVVPKKVADIADHLVKFVPFMSPNGVVETEQDWIIVTKLFEAFIDCYGYEYQSFLESTGRIKSANDLTRGYSDDKAIQHQLEIPEKFHQLIKIFYPLQGYDTKFTRRLGKEIPILNAV